MGPYIAMTVLMVVGVFVVTSFVDERGEDRRRVDRQLCVAANKGVKAAERAVEAAEKPLNVLVRVLDLALAGADASDPGVGAFKRETDREINGARDAIDVARKAVASARQDCDELPEP